MNKRHIVLLLSIFVLLLSICYILTRYLPALDKTALVVGNIVMAGLTFFGFYMVSKSVSERPEAFVRGVYSATLLKLFVCMIGIVSYAVVNRATIYKPTLFALFGIYIIYTVVETTVLSKTAPQKIRQQMAKEEREIAALAQFLPKGAFNLVAPFFDAHLIHLTLTKERKSVHGDYRTPVRGSKAHRISVNITLNKYSFLVTLLHELAHLTAFVAFKNKIAPHGAEWKAHFREILMPFLGAGVFPKDVHAAITQYLKDPAASTCTDPVLYKTLRRYDAGKEGWKLVEELAVGAHFETADGRRFIKIEQLRTRSKCREVASGKIYLFSGLAEVSVVA